MLAVDYLAYLKYLREKYRREEAKLRKEAAKYK